MFTLQNEKKTRSSILSCSLFVCARDRTRWWTTRSCRTSSASRTSAKGSPCTPSRGCRPTRSSPTPFSSGKKRSDRGRTEESKSMGQGQKWLRVSARGIKGWLPGGGGGSSKLQMLRAEQIPRGFEERICSCSKHSTNRTAQSSYFEFRNGGTTYLWSGQRLSCGGSVAVVACLPCHVGVPCAPCTHSFAFPAFHVTIN